MKRKKAKQSKTQGRKILPTKDINKAVKQEGLRLQWIKFIDSYMKNGGNGSRAYKEAYETPDHKVSDKVATINASRLLRKDSVVNEINYRLNAQRCTDDFVKDGLIDIAVNYRKKETLNASVRALEILAKIKGMLTDTKVAVFTGDNPAVFMPLYTKEEKESFDKLKENNQRLVE